jgi:hypothetical protein
MTIELFSPTVTVDTSIYASGDLIGAKLTLSNFFQFNNVATLQGVVLVDQAKQSAALDIIFFGANPSGTTFTDNAALDVADADMSKILGAVNVLSANYYALNDNSIAVVKDINLKLKGTASTVYACLVSRGTPTYAASTDLVLSLLVDR